MKRRSFLLGSLFGTGSMLFPIEGWSVGPSPDLTIDPYTKQRIKTLTALMPEKRGTAERLVALSEGFLGTPYQTNRLIGSATQPEQLVIDFRSVDCLSFLEYLYALNNSTSYDTFIQELVRTRYRNGVVSFPTRRHFFSDWVDEPPQLARDITSLLDHKKATTVTKYLNRKDRKGGLWLPGIAVKKRQITHIPTGHITPALLRNIEPGDLVGIYTKQPGSDVTHTGLVVHSHKRLMFRNASSLFRNQKVVDTPLQDYVMQKPGMVVFRCV